MLTVKRKNAPARYKAVKRVPMIAVATSAHPLRAAQRWSSAAPSNAQRCEGSCAVSADGRAEGATVRWSDGVGGITWQRHGARNQVAAKVRAPLQQIETACATADLCEETES